MDTAFVIGNGESRPIFPIQDLKNKGIIYGCNAIYRDNPELCDHIVAVNPPMYEELKAWHDHNRPNLKMCGPKDASWWFKITNDGDKIYRRMILENIKSINIPVNQLIVKQAEEDKRIYRMSHVFGMTKVNQIAKAVQNKQTMPPIHVRRYKNGYQIIDGHHRFLGHRKAGADSIKAKIVTLADMEAAHLKIHGPEDISAWNYICEGDHEQDVPHGLKIYRMWRGGDIKKGNGIRTIDFAMSRGSGMSAVLMAAESGIQNVVILAFDILGARQWEMDSPSRQQNNMYKNTINYPDRMSMKAYLKYEWMYQLRQIVRKHPNTNFHFINRKEYIEGNTFLRWYFDQPNIRTGTYADLRRWIDGKRDDIKWIKL